jgi:sterol desaturase/sphingolipid hydroxylase (fatty acid hydroxylase superfamily)
MLDNIDFPIEFITIPTEFVLGFLFLGLALWLPYRSMKGKLEIDWDIIGHIFGTGCTLAYVFLLENPVYGWLVDVDSIVRYQEVIQQLPFWAVGTAYLILSDFLGYWTHRAMHTRAIWSHHAWHHSPEVVYWLSGMRGSFVHFVFSLAPYTVAYLLLPMDNFGNTFFVIMIFNMVNQHYIHSNIRVRCQRQLEAIFVTPRTHLVHHSAKQQWTDSNYGFVLSIWDRLFGTFTDPDTVPKDDPLGLDYNHANWALMMGIAKPK